MWSPILAHEGGPAGVWRPSCGHAHSATTNNPLEQQETERCEEQPERPRRASSSAMTKALGRGERADASQARHHAVRRRVPASPTTTGREMLARQAAELGAKRHVARGIDADVDVSNTALADWMLDGGSLTVHPSRD